MEKLKAEAKQAAALPVENLVETQPWRQQRATKQSVRPAKVNANKLVDQDDQRFYR